MNKQPSVTFVKVFSTLEQAEDWSTQIVGPSVIIHLYKNQENQLYAVCDQAGIDMLQETIDENAYWENKK